MGLPSLTWVGPDGSETLLTNDSTASYERWAVGEIDGLGAPEIVTWSRELALANGAVWSGSRLASRNIFIPIAVDAPTFAGRKLAIRNLSTAFLLGGKPVEGKLRINYADGEVRSLRRVRLTDGLRDPMPGPGFYVTGVELTAYDPLLYGREQTAAWSVTAPVEFFPGPPFSLSVSTVTDTIPVTIPGEVAVYPRWRLEGPLTTFTATLGEESWTWSVPLSAGEWVDIDTDPSVPLSKRVVDQNGTNRWADMVAGGFPSLFQLAVGPNNVTVSFAGESADTEVSLAWTPAYLTW